MTVRLYPASIQACKLVIYMYYIYIYKLAQCSVQGPKPVFKDCTHAPTLKVCSTGQNRMSSFPFVLAGATWPSYLWILRNRNVIWDFQWRVRNANIIYVCTIYETGCACPNIIIGRGISEINISISENSTLQLTNNSHNSVLIKLVWIFFQLNTKG